MAKSRRVLIIYSPDKTELRIPLSDDHHLCPTEIWAYVRKIGFPDGSSFEIIGKPFQTCVEKVRFERYVKGSTYKIPEGVGSVALV